MEKHYKMKYLCKILRCKLLEEGEFLPTQWLTKWLDDVEKLGPIDTSALLCEHEKLNPEKFREFKLVSFTAVFTQFY